jgi:hypothetical protein
MLSWNEIHHRSIAIFEEPVNKLSRTRGYIDLFWPGRILIGDKSAKQPQTEVIPSQFAPRSVKKHDTNLIS